MNEIALKAAKEHASHTKTGGYVTDDGQVFNLGKEGLSYCRAHCGNTRDAWEFDANGEYVEPKDSEQLRADAIEALKDHYSEAELASMNTESLMEIAAKTSTNSTDGNGPDDEDVIDLDKMNKAELIAYLVSLDPTEDGEKLTKAKPTNNELKDKIEAANGLTGETFDLEKMKSLAVAFGAEIDSMKDLDVDDCRHLVLSLRDQIELPESVQNKMNGGNAE